MSPSHPIEPAGPGTESSPQPKRKISPRSLAPAALGGVLVLFAVFNRQTVSIHWIVSSTRTPLIVVIAGCALLGFAVGWLAHWRSTTRRKGKA